MEIVPDSQFDSNTAPSSPSSCSSSYSLSSDVGSPQGIPAVVVCNDCVNPSVVLDAFPTSDFESDSMECEDEGWIPCPWEVSIAFNKAERSYLDTCLHASVAVMPKSSSSDEMPSPSEASRDRMGEGPSGYYLRAHWRLNLDRYINHFHNFYFVKDPYILYKPGPEETVMTPPANCTAVYKANFELGLRFPLHPFIVQLLTAYNLGICNLYPNSWAAISSFLAICDIMEIEPSLVLWRNLFRLQECRAEPHGRGWYLFQVRQGY